jgi:ABC-type lipoprotein export system ATPase subunit
MNDYILYSKGLWKIFEVSEEKIEVLRGIDFGIKRGNSVLIQGPSGSGKTTFLMLLSLLDVPTRGEIYIKGKKIEFDKDKEVSLIRNRMFGFIFQFYNLLPEFTALENVMVPLLLRGIKVKEARDRAEEMLKKVGLYDKRNRFPKELSGGEEQRISIARAVVGFPEVIFADEPTGNLDEENAVKIMSLLFDLVQNFGVSLIVVSHNKKWEEYFEDVYVLEKGKLIKRE